MQTPDAVQPLVAAGVTFTGFERNRAYVGLEFQGQRFQLHRTYLLMPCFQQPDGDLAECLADFATGR